MKKFLTIVGLMTIVATPAFAQLFDPDNGTGNVMGSHTNRLLLRTTKPQSVRATYVLLPWFRNAAPRACRSSITARALRNIRSVRGTTFLIRTAHMATPITGNGWGGRAACNVHAWASRR